MSVLFKSSTNCVVASKLLEQTVFHRLNESSCDMPLAHAHLRDDANSPVD